MDHMDFGEIIEPRKFAITRARIHDGSYGFWINYRALFNLSCSNFAFVSGLKKGFPSLK